MVGARPAGLFFGLILPHGLLELTAVFVAAGAGLRLGWSWIDPGRRTRAQALREEGRAAGARGPRPGRGAARLRRGRGVRHAVAACRPGPGSASAPRVWLAFLAYVVVLGRRAVRAGETGDLRGAGGTDVAPTAG